MSPTRKFAFAWAVIATAIYIALLAASFIYLREEYVTDQSLVEARIKVVAAERGFKLEEARKDGISDSEIAKHFIETDRAQFNHLWWEIVLVVSAIYTVFVLGIFAYTLLRESKNENGNS